MLVGEFQGLPLTQGRHRPCCRLRRHLELFDSAVMQRRAIRHQTFVCQGDEGDLVLSGSPRKNHFSPCNVCRTCSGCFSAFATLAQCFFTLPSGPIQTVERITPTVFLPYIVFSPYAPYFRITLRSGSERSGNGS